MQAIVSLVELGFQGTRVLCSFLCAFNLGLKLTETLALTSGEEVLQSKLRTPEALPTKSAQIRKHTATTKTHVLVNLKAHGEGLSLRISKNSKTTKNNVFKKNFCLVQNLLEPFFW